MAYWWRIVKLSVIVSFLPQSSSSIFEFATNTNQRKTQTFWQRAALPFVKMIGSWPLLVRNTARLLKASSAGE
jgi:hypothetical protein